MHLPCQEVGSPLQLFDAAVIVSETTQPTPPITAQPLPPPTVAGDRPAGAGGKQKPAKRKRLQDPQPPAAPPPATEEHHAVDCTFYAGGAVWSMDWCPYCPTAYSHDAPNPQPQPSQKTHPEPGAHDLLAVSAHHKNHSRNKAGKTLTGTGAIQLWSVPISTSSSSNSSSMDNQAPLPKLQALLLHEGKLAWDIKWCPNPSYYLTGNSSSSEVAGLSGTSGDHHQQQVQQQQQRGVPMGQGRSFEELTLWDQEAAEDR